MGFQAVGRTGVGNYRHGNEDALVLIPELRFVAVLDGTGGPESGQWAAEWLQKAVRARLGAGLNSQQLLDAVKEARLKLSALSNGESEFRGYTATFAAAHFGDDSVSVLNAGDVQAFRFPRGDAPVALLTQHLFGRIIRERFPELTEAEIEKYKNVTTQTLLHPGDAEFEATRIPLNPGEVLLICTDGVHSYVALEAVQRAWEALPAPTLEMRADVLEQMILAGEAKDNYAFVIAEL